MRGDNDLTIGSVWRVLIAFAIPILLGIILQSLYVIVDAIIIGKFAGKSALATIESVYTLTKLPVNFFVGMSTGATIIISQYFGAKNSQRVSDACHTAIVFSLIGGAILSVLMIVISPIMINVLNVPNEIASDAQTYVIIYFGGLAAMMTYNIGAGIFRALGNSKTPFYFLIIANVLNITLDLIFVAAFDLGVKGAGVATVVSQITCAILMFIALLKTNMSCRIVLKRLKIHREHLRSFLTLGLPVGIQSMLYPISNMFIQTSINTFGVNAIAAWAICGKLDFFVWYIPDAMSQAISTFVAQNVGAKKIKRTKQGVIVGTMIALVIVIIVSVILYYFNHLFSLALVDDQSVIAIVSQIMAFLAPLYFLYVLGAILPGAIRGAGESFKPMVITLLLSALLRVVWIIVVLPVKPTLMMTLASYPVSWAITSLAFIIYYQRYFSKLEHQIEPCVEAIYNR